MGRSTGSPDLAAIPIMPGVIMEPAGPPLLRAHVLQKGKMAACAAVVVALTLAMRYRIGRRDYDITEIDISESDVAEFDITENDITESDITETNIT